MKRHSEEGEQDQSCGIQRRIKRGVLSLTRLSTTPNIGKCFTSSSAACTLLLGVTPCRATIKQVLALYVGGMGAKGKNFYYDLACRYGFDAAADRVQELYLQGQKDAAARAIPDELVDAVALARAVAIISAAGASVGFIWKARIDRAWATSAGKRLAR